jgi:GMP synthase (glutamine-hydrolysing)
MMSGKVVLITHDSADKDDRAATWLRAQGFTLHWTCPAEGGALPELSSEVAALVVYGGRYDVRDRNRHAFLNDELRCIEGALGRGIPFLGLCLGGQLLAHVLGEDVGPHPQGLVEYGYYDLEPTRQGREIFGDGLKVLQSHWHGWYRTPAGAVGLGGTAHFPEQAFRYGSNAYAFQFHPEASRSMLEAWIARRPPERHQLPGAFPPERQRADFATHDPALGRWFHGFLHHWLAPRMMSEAAE